MFYGCNTSSFAKKWSETFKVKAEGARGKVNFDTSSFMGIERSATVGWDKLTP